MAAIDQPRHRSWRPFQLAFLLLNVRGLVDPTHDERQELADLLWFPTGGGKTEAYLGVAAFTMAIRRLQGDLGGLVSGAGVTVLMRYTLRLLTLQQFQRATTLIMACEFLRRQNVAQWGTEPFRIGLWVGQSSTPNWTKDAAEVIKSKRTNEWQGSSGGKGTPLQLTNCPWCGTPIDAGKHIEVEVYEKGHGRTFQYCGDKYGQCPFSKKQAPREGMPIVVVDEEIYRLLPTLLIATVDKFAQMPWKGPTQMLFGRVTGRCSRHGFRSPDLTDEDRHLANNRLGLPAAKTVRMGPLRPPDLIIQDELHLISGPLGTLVGLYETAVDTLSTWTLNGQSIRPKVIASTATIRRAREQVNSVFAREVKIFPPPGLDAEDNFFAKQRPSKDDTPGRLYMGICAPGLRFKSLLLRVYVAYLAAAQTLFEEYGELADPWMSLVGYFNSLRELGGMRRLTEDAVRERLQRTEERGLAKRFLQEVEELTSRRSAEDIPKILDKLERRFTTATVGLGKGKNKGKFREGERPPQPIDVALSTNMISVGVDVSRLGLMVVAGQPKATAEYIQATSRVGRRFPGLVCTVFNWTRPRDLSHYERFAHYHATFYEQVEALSVTPFAPRALDRGLTGVYVSLMRLLSDELNSNQSAHNLRRDHPLVVQAREAIIDRATAVQESQSAAKDVRLRLVSLHDQWMSRIKSGLGSTLGYRDARDSRTIGLLSQPLEKDWDIFTCLNSLRDVEPSVKLVLDDTGMDREPSNPKGGMNDQV